MDNGWRGLSSEQRSGRNKMRWDKQVRTINQNLASFPGLPGLPITIATLTHVGKPGNEATRKCSPKSSTGNHINKIKKQKETMCSHLCMQKLISQLLLCTHACNC